MMNNLRRWCWVSCFVILVGNLTGCILKPVDFSRWKPEPKGLMVASAISPDESDSIDDSHKMIADQSAYRVTGSSDWDIWAEGTNIIGVADVRETLHVSMFWKPKPGVTHSDPTSTNAVLRYVVEDEQNKVVFVGTGFVFPKGKPGKKMEFAIERSRLKQVGCWGESPIECELLSIVGDIETKEDGSRVTRGIRLIEADIRDVEDISAD